jgi:hypothetical protein
VEERICSRQQAPFQLRCCGLPLVKSIYKFSKNLIYLSPSFSLSGTSLESTEQSASMRQVPPDTAPATPTKQMEVVLPSPQTEEIYRGKIPRSLESISTSPSAPMSLAISCISLCLPIVDPTIAKIVYCHHWSIHLMRSVFFQFDCLWQFTLILYASPSLLRVDIVLEIIEAKIYSDAGATASHTYERV